MILLLDSETTGLKPPIEIIELAYLTLTNNVSIYKAMSKLNPLTDFEWAIFSERFKPVGEIHPQASELHNIYLRDLLKCRPSAEVKIPSDTTILLGYNIIFDHRVLGKPNTKLICLWQIAKKIWKQDKLDKKLENFKQTTLINYLYPETEGELTKNAHGAEADVKLSYLLLLKVIEKLPRLKTLDELVELTTQPKS